MIFGGLRLQKTDMIDGLVVEAPEPLPEAIMTELRAHALGLTGDGLFSVRRERPWAQLDMMGLEALLNGGRVTALSNIEAVIEKPSGARLRFRRHGQASDETCPVWGLK